MNQVSVTVPIKKGVRSYKCEIPENASELTADDDLYILQVSSLDSEVNRHLMILHYFMDVPDAVFYSIAPHLFLELMELVQWIEIEPSATHTIPEFVIDGVTYAGPETKFQNGTAWEYVVADEYYNGAMVDKIDDDLYLFMATILRPVLSDADADRYGDRRQPLHYNFNKYEIARRAKIFEVYFSEPKNKAIQLRSILYFEGVKRFVHETFGQYLFKTKQTDTDQTDEDENDDEPQEEYQEPSAATFGWWSLFMSVAKDGLFGNLEAVYRTNFIQFCMYMVDKTKEIEAHNRRIEMQKIKNKS